MRRARPLLASVAGAVLGACGLVGGGEITVTARNDSDLPMVVQVVDASGEAHGPAHQLAPLEERDVELALPGGDWTVEINGARLLTASDAAGRRGRLPVTLIMPAPDDPIGVPHWQAPSDWAGSGG